MTLTCCTVPLSERILSVRPTMLQRFGPGFLYIEANGEHNGGKVSRLEDPELATRMALLLWLSTPDDELLNLAKASKLHEPAALEAQTRRMLKDQRSWELSESFTVQWQRLDQLYAAKPDRDIFQDFYSGPQGKSTLHGAALTEALRERSLQGS